MASTLSQKAKARNDLIMKAALDLSFEKGFQNITRDGVARRANIAAGSVNAAYGTIDDLKQEVMRFAVRNEVLKIIAQGLAAGSSIALEAPQALKEEAVSTLA